MLEIAYIIGITIGLTEILKRKLNISNLYVWIPIMLIACGLNILNAFCFGDIFNLEVARTAAKEGIMVALQSAGIYGLGKAVIEGKKNITE